jgi:hypothetical protein
MIESLYGTASPPWPGAPIGLGWPPGSRPLPSTIAHSQQMIPVSVDPGELGRINGPQPLFAGLPPVLAGYTIPALLAAVAVRRGQPLGPTNDQELEDFVYDALELVPGTNDVEARVDGGRVTLTGLVHHKRLKRDIGEIVWGIPIVSDVHNNMTIASRRRSRGPGRESEPPQPRKQG